MDKPKITVIIPIYNTEKYLNKCIESVVNQTFTNLEIILVNDGSTDNSLVICNKYAKVDNRIVIIDKLNGGVSSARNSGLDIAKGEYIGFIDSDDYVDTRMYEKLFGAITEHNADIAECGYCTTDTEYKITRRYEFKYSINEGNYECSYNYLTKENTTNFNVNKLYRKELFDDVRYPDLTSSEDYIVNVKIFYKCNKKVTIEGCYYYYLTNTDSTCNRPFSISRLDAIKAGKEMFLFHKERFNDLCPLIALYIANYCMKYYCILRDSDISNNVHFSKEMICDFKRYYPLIKGDVVKIKFKIKVLMFIFNLSPRFYYYLKKVFKKGVKI